MEKEWSFFECTLQRIHSQLGSPCKATLLNGSEYAGYLYNVDPETRTVLILWRHSEEPGQQEGEGEQAQEPLHEPHPGQTGPAGPNTHTPWTMVAVRQHAISSWRCTENPGSDRLSLEEMDAIAHISQTPSSPAEIEARKGRLVVMLRSKRIPVETTAEDLVVHIMGSAHVHPPYLPMSVDCKNAVVRERVKGMVQELGQT